MSKYTMTFRKGRGNQKHNSRELKQKHVDQSRTKDNVVMFEKDIREVYHEKFDEAVAEYNSKQKRKDRIIKDYYKKIKNSKQEKTFYEVLAQIGNKDERPDEEICNKILKDFIECFHQENTNLVVIGAYIHNDEKSVHAHIDYVPVAKATSKRGLQVKNSHDLAIKQMGFKSWSGWHDHWTQRLETICKEYGIERKYANDDRQHLSISQYKKEMEKANQEYEESIASSKTNKFIYTEKDVQKLKDSESKSRVAFEEIEAKYYEITEELHVLKHTDLVQENDNLQKDIVNLKNEIVDLGSQNRLLEHNNRNLKVELQKSQESIVELKEEIKTIDAERNVLQRFISVLGLNECYEAFKTKMTSKYNILTRKEKLAFMKNAIASITGIFDKLQKELDLHKKKSNERSR